MFYVKSQENCWRKYYKLYANQVEHLDIGKFKTKFIKTKEIRNLNTVILIKEVKTVIKNLPIKANSRPG